MAKREKKLKKNWNFFEIGVILIALCGMFLPGLRAEDYDCNRKIAKLQAEIERLKKENAELRVTNGRLKASSQEEGSVLRKELIETLDKYSTQAGRLKRLEMSAAGTIETLEPVYMGAREMELEADLKQCAESIGRLSVEVLRYCEETNAVLSRNVSNPLEAARMRLKLEALKELAMKSALLAKPAVVPEKLESCRIYELNEKPELVILSAGYRNGVRMGLILRTEKVAMKVIAMRNFTSAAVVIEGSFRDLAPGMEVRAVSR